MPISFFPLHQYPLEVHYSKCKSFLNQNLNWAEIREDIRTRGVIHFDISAVISLFPHLELDENYRLICYLSKEYHGIWGRIAAMQIGSSLDPVIPKDKEWLSKLFHGPYFELPESAAPPMEAIYNDGSPTGYYEAILCDLFLHAIPYTHFEKNHWHIVMTTPPHDLKKSWDVFVDIPDWQPRAYGEDDLNTIILLRREIENGFGGSSGRDRIYLTQYNFQDQLDMVHAFASPKDHSMYNGQIKDNNRFNQHRKCSVTSSKSILVAQECDYTVKEH